MEYLTFCGIKLRGETSDILRNFRDRGFEITSDTTSINDGEDVFMSGILYDEKCEITMCYSSAYNGFHSIGIHLTRRYYSWDLLSGKFYQIKDEMCKQYGVSQPFLLHSFIKKFKQGNNNEMRHLDEINYRATFFLPLFYAEVFIQKDATIGIGIHDNIYDETIHKNRPDLITEVYK